MSKIDVEAREVAPLLALDLVDLEAREHHAAFLMLGGGSGRKPSGNRVPIANLLRRHAGETVPRRSCGEFDADSFLDRLGVVHRDAGRPGGCSDRIAH